MSSSKAGPKVAAAEDRRPKCTRCRHHGIIVPQKGHMKNCLFLQCTCWKCYLVSQRTRITALLRNPKTGQDKEERPGGDPTGINTVKPASEGHRSGSVSSAGAGPSATSGSIATDSASARSPLDLRSKPAAGGERAAGEEREEQPLSEESPAGFNPPYLGDFEAPPVPVVRLPWPVHPSSSYAPCPNFMLNMLWFPPAPPGFYNSSLRGSFMFPHFQPVAAHPLPPPGPEAADSRRLVVTLQPPPEFLHQEVMAVQRTADTQELK